MALSYGAIWRHREKLRHMCTTTVHPAYNGSKKFLENLLPVKLLVRTNLFIPSRLRYVATCGKNLYRCTSTFSALNYFGGIFFISLSYLYEVVRKNFSADFWTLRNFDGNFAKIVAPTGDLTDNHVVHLTEQSFLKKRWKWHQNRPSPLIVTQYLFELCPPRAGRPSATYKKNTNFRSYSPRAYFDLSQTLHADRERPDNSKRSQSFFDPTHSFSCRGENADFWSLTHWVNLIPSGCHGNLPVNRKE